MPVSVTVAQFARILEWKTGQNRQKQHFGLYVAKLNLELDHGMGDKVGHANFRGRSAIFTCPRVFTDGQMTEKEPMRRQ